LIQNARIVSVFTLLSQIVAFARTAIIASVFGVSTLIDAYNLSLVVPTLLAGVISGWMQVGFVGRYIECRRDTNEAAAIAFRTAMGGVLVAIAVAAALTMLISNEPITAMLVPASSASTRVQAGAALQIIAWSLVLITFSDYLGLILNCHGRFVAAAAAPIVNALVSAGLLLVWHQKTLETLVWTLMLGWIAQLVVVALACARAGLWEFAWRRTAGDDVKSTLQLALPILPAVVFSNGTLVVINVFCSHLGEGAVAIYGYASKLHGALTQVIIVGIGTVLLPHLASLLADGQREQIELLFRRIGRATMLISVLVMAGVIMLGQPVIMVLLGRGRFDAATAASVNSAWTILTLSLFPFALATFFAKLFQAMRQPVLLSISALVSLVATTVACYFGQSFLGIRGVMLAPFVAQVSVLVYFLVVYKKKFGDAGFLPEWARAAALCVAMVVPSCVIDWLVRGYLDPLGRELAFGLRAVLFVGVFAAVVKLSGAFNWIARVNAP
jgi:putative peptidoglycan lipid II flippase